MTLDLPTVLYATSAIILCGILADKLWLRARTHFSAFEQCRRGVDDEGTERLYWSFHSFRRNTIIGNTIGVICIEFAAWQFSRRHPAAPLVTSRSPDIA